MANDNSSQPLRPTDEQPLSQHHRITGRARRHALIRDDAWGNLLDAEATETIRCAVCCGTAECLPSAWQGEGIAYHNYQCRTSRYPAAGTIIEHESGESQRVRPIFGDRNLAVRLATREDVDAPAESREVAP